jgi:hypothetical protein
MAVACLGGTGGVALLGEEEQEEEDTSDGY